MTGDAPLMLTRVDKTLAGRRVLSQVDFDCPPGSITGLLGPNGAGKTTTVTIAAGLRRPNNGTVRVFGLDPVSGNARRRFSVIPQEISFPGPVRVSHCLAFVEGQREPTEFALGRDRLCDELGLTGLLHRSVGGLSGGQRRKLAIALGLVRVPGLLILDEATSNLDEPARRATWRLVCDYAARGGTVLATTHILADIEAYADRVIAMAEGRVVRSGPMSEIRESLGGSTISASIASTAQRELTVRIVRDGLGTLQPADESTSRMSWRTHSPVQLVALIAAIDPTATDLEVGPTPLSELLDLPAPVRTTAEVTA
jgi:ABC-2 type transport system ATP-binding protein